MEKSSGSGSKNNNAVEVLDGSNIMELVGSKHVFNKFVNHKFQELDKDKDGQLSVIELQPAVSDIGAALGLPSQGTNPDSDHIYSQVNSFLFLFISCLIIFQILPMCFRTSIFQHHAFIISWIINNTNAPHFLSTKKVKQY
jgi:hypothetical protein